MISKIEQAKTSADWKREKSRYVPYLSTWLDNMGWKDDYSPDDDPDDCPNWAKEIE